MGEVARRIDRAAEEPPNDARKCAEALFHCLATYHAQQAGSFVALRLRCFPVERPPTDRLRVRIKDQGNIRCGTDWEELARKGDGFRRIRSLSMVYLSECIIFIGVLVASVVTASQFWLPLWLQLHGRGRASGFGANLNDPQSFACMRASTVPSRLTRALLSLAWASIPRSSMARKNLMARSRPLSGSAFGPPTAPLTHCQPLWPLRSLMRRYACSSLSWMSLSTSLANGAPLSHYIEPCTRFGPGVGTAAAFAIKNENHM